MSTCKVCKGPLKDATKIGAHYICAARAKRGAATPDPNKATHPVRLFSTEWHKRDKAAQ